MTTRSWWWSWTRLHQAVLGPMVLCTAAATTQMAPAQEWTTDGREAFPRLVAESSEQPQAEVDPELYRPASYLESAEAADAAPKSAEERLKAIEDSLKKADDAAKKKKADDAKKPTLKVSGRIHLDSWNFPDSDPLTNVIERDDLTESPEDRINFRRMRFGVAGDIPFNMVYKIEMEFAGGNASEYRDVYLGWKDLPVVFDQVLIGNQKRPYGLDHLNSSRYNIFMERPFVIEGFNQDARRIGICGYGVSDDEAWNWRGGYYMGEIAQADAGPIGDPWQGEFAGRMANTIWYDESSDGRGYAHWAVSGAYADPSATNGSGRTGSGQHVSTANFNTRPEARTSQRWLNTGAIVGADDYQLLGLESLVNVGPLQFCSEYQNVWMSRIDGADDLFFYGFYSQVGYFITGEHIPWERDSGTLGRVKPFQNFFWVRTCRDTCDWGWGAWQVAARYSYADFSSEDILGGVGESLTFGVNWHWNPNARVQFNYINGQIRDSRFANADTGPKGNYDVVGIRWMVDF